MSLAEFFGKIEDNGKWCCESCRQNANALRSTMICCAECGNKRCPKAENHLFKCTRSNDTNQVGVLENG